MIELRGYIDESGKKRFAQWLDGLDAAAAAKVTIALTRLEQGNFSKVTSVGSGVFECKIDFGPVPPTVAALEVDLDSGAARIGLLPKAAAP